MDWIESLQSTINLKICCLQSASGNCNPTLKEPGCDNVLCGKLFGISFKVPKGLIITIFRNKSFSYQAEKVIKLEETCINIILLELNFIHV